MVYHIVDEYSAHPVITDREAFLEQERELIRRADVVLVTSQALLESKGGINPSTYLVPNAVDYTGFQLALNQERLDPTGSWDVPRPWIGYAGALNEKIDFELLVRVATAQPDWHLILIGSLDLYAQPHKADVLRSLPNVHWMGRISVADLPRAIRAMDVCLLPYERNEWTGHIDSLKLYEYFACGRPVGKHRHPAAEAQKDLVRLARTPDQFVDQIRVSLNEHGTDLVEQRKSVAAANTWDDRVALIERLLGEALSRKQDARGLLQPDDREPGHCLLWTRAVGWDVAQPASATHPTGARQPSAIRAATPLLESDRRLVARRQDLTCRPVSGARTHRIGEQFVGIQLAAIRPHWRGTAFRPVTHALRRRLLRAALGQLGMHDVVLCFHDRIMPKIDSICRPSADLSHR